VNNKQMMMGMMAALMAGATAGTAAAQAVSTQAVSTQAVSVQADTAQAGRAAPRAHVRYADLDLSRATDRTRLARRIAAAADALCGWAPPIGDLAATEAYRTCMRVTIASSTPSIEQAARQQSGSRELAQVGER
jgi:UrcA family protein